jgi:hypothetical protein
VIEGERRVNQFPSASRDLRGGLGPIVPDREAIGGGQSASVRFIETTPTARGPFRGRGEHFFNRDASPAIETPVVVLAHLPDATTGNPRPDQGTRAGCVN